MHDTTFVLWLQQSASPAVTACLWAVTLCGYVPACLAAAIGCGFGGRLRVGVMLVLAIVVADAMTVVAKGAFASPRPHAVDAHVRTFGFAESRLTRLAASTAVPADDFGFPSGHVATTAAWTVGLASLRRSWRRRSVAAAWVALMAVSRMYLGRHFPVDVLGGLVVGLVGLGVARVGLPLGAAGDDTLTTGTRTALDASLIVAVALAALSGVGLGAHDAGRFCGLMGAALVLTRLRALDDVVPPGLRVARVAVALVVLGVALWSSTWTTTGPGLEGLSTMAVSAAVHAGVLLVPALALRDRSAAPLAPTADGGR